MSVSYYLLLLLFPLSGGLLAYYTKTRKLNNFKFILAFAGAYLLSIVLFHLIPHLFHHFDVVPGILLLCGFLFQLIIERFSRGVEHGHMHLHKSGNVSPAVPYEILLSLSLHSFMEGMPLGSTYLLNDAGKLTFLFGIVLHEFPAAFAMVSILKSMHISGKRLLAFIFIYSSMSSFGALSSSYLNSWIDPHVFEYIMAFVIGTFLHIATTILFENSEHHKLSGARLAAILLGIALAAVVSLR